METLKAHEALFKKGYWTEGAIYFIIVDLELLSNNTTCNRDSWG